MPSLLDGDEAIREGQLAIVRFADAIRLGLRDLADANDRRGLWLTCDERIALLQKGIRVYEIIFDQGDFIMFIATFRKRTVSWPLCPYRRERRNRPSAF